MPFFSDPDFQDDMQDIDWGNLEADDTLVGGGEKGAGKGGGFQLLLPASTLLSSNAIEKLRGPKGGDGKEVEAPDSDPIEPFSDNPTPKKKKFNPLLTPTPPPRAGTPQESEPETEDRVGLSSSDPQLNASPASPGVSNLFTQTTGSGDSDESVPESKEPEREELNKKVDAMDVDDETQQESAKASKEGQASNTETTNASTTDKDNREGGGDVEMLDGEGNAATSELPHAPAIPMDEQSENMGNVLVEDTPVRERQKSMGRNSEALAKIQKVSIAEPKPVGGESDASSTESEADDDGDGGAMEKLVKLIENHDAKYGYGGKAKKTPQNGTNEPNKTEGDPKNAPKAQRTMEAPPSTLDSSQPTHSSPLGRFAKKLAGAFTGKRKSSKSDSSSSDEEPETRAPVAKKAKSNTTKGKKKSKEFISTSDDDTDREDSAKPSKPSKPKPKKISVSVSESDDDTEREDSAKPSKPSDPKPKKTSVSVSESDDDTEREDSAKPSKPSDPKPKKTSVEKASVKNGEGVSSTKKALKNVAKTVHRVVSGSSASSAAKSNPNANIGGKESTPAEAKSKKVIKKVVKDVTSKGTSKTSEASQKLDKSSNASGDISVNQTSNSKATDKSSKKKKEGEKRTKAKASTEASSEALTIEQKKHAEEVRKQQIRDVREETKTRKAERVTKVLGTGTNPLSQFTLGWGILDVVHERDGGKGPDIVPHESQRELEDKQVQVFVTANLSEKGLDRLNHKHAMILAVRKKTLDVTKLAKTMNDEVTRIPWTPEAAGSKAVRLTGGHRCEAVCICVEKQEKLLEQVKEKLAKVKEAKPRGWEKKAGDYEETIEKGVIAVEKNSVWIVQIVDLDAIEASPDRLIIEQQLTANLDLATLKDSETQQLTTILYQLARANTVDERKAVLVNAEHLNLGPKKSPLKTLAKRGIGLIEFLVRVLPFRAFSSEVYLNVAELVDFNVYCWGMLEPVLEGNLYELFYLCSDAPLPFGLDKESLSDFSHSDIRDHLRAQGERRADWKISTPVANCVITAAERAFRGSRLGDHHLGSPIALYQEEWDSYVRILPSILRTVLKESRQKEPRLWENSLDKAVANTVQLKLQFMLEGQHWRNAELMPLLAGPIPIFCPSVWSHFISTWLPLKDVLYMVANWFVPCLHTVGVQNRSKGDVVPFTSFPYGIFQALQYWYGYDLEHDLGSGVWESLTPEEVCAQDDSCTVLKAWFKIISVLFEHKVDMLMPLQKVLPFMKQANPNSPAGGSKPPSDIGDLIQAYGVSAMGKWNLKAAGVNKTAVALVNSRTLPVAPPSAREELTRKGCPPWLNDLLNMVERVPFNVLTASRHTNNKTLYKNLLEGAWLEKKFYSEELMPIVTEHFPQVSLLFHRLRKIVVTSPGLKTFQFWPSFPKPSRKVSKLNVEDLRDYSDQRMEEDFQSRVALLNKATATFVRQISRSGCLGIRDQESGQGQDSEAVYRLHPSMEQLLSDLHSKGVQLATDLATISHNPELDEWPEVTVTDRRELQKYWDQQGVKIEVATEEDVKSFYQVDEVLDAKKERTDAKGKSKAKVKGEAGTQGARESSEESDANDGPEDEEDDEERDEDKSMEVGEDHGDEGEGSGKENGGELQQQEVTPKKVKVASDENAESEDEPESEDEAESEDEPESEGEPESEDEPGSENEPEGEDEPESEDGEETSGETEPRKQLKRKDHREHSGPQGKKARIE